MSVDGWSQKADESIRIIANKTYFFSQGQNKNKKKKIA
jgi:hypothetical protein